MAAYKTQTVIVALSFFVLVSGCATWRKYSKASAESSNGWEMKYALGDTEGVLRNGEVELYVDPVNDGPSHGVTILPIPGIPMGTWAEAKKGWKVFEVRVMVRTFVHGYGFNPAKVHLKTSDDKDATPYMYYFSPDARLCFYGSPNDISADAKYLPIEDKYFMIPLYPAKVEVYDGCFSILFSREPPDTSEVFSLVVDGLAKEQHRLTIPKIVFQEGTRGSGW